VSVLLLLGCGEERHALVIVQAAEGASFDVESLEVTARLEPPDAEPRVETATLPRGGRKVALPADLVVQIGRAHV
jgi:hypothetical protein